MANEAISNIALLYSMAALSSEGGSGGGSGGTVSVKVHATYTIESTEEARVENVGTEKDVQLDFYIPRGLDGKSSQWYISDGKPRSAVEGSTDGDLILYTTGDVYKVINGVPVDQHLSLNVGQSDSPYTYAVKAGFKGSEEKFQELWLASLNSGYTNSILDGGNSDFSGQKVQNDGGEGDSKTHHLRVDGINELDD